jgi:hypothetical protein
MVAAVILMLISMLCIVGLVLVTLFTAGGARAEIASQDPAYAARLYRSAAAMAWDNSPVRLTVLFRVEPPASVRPTVVLLRWLYAVLGFFVAGFVLGGILLSRFAA